eukprot:5293689-Alexandrium_andersonii.AAC.1
MGLRHGHSGDCPGPQAERRALRAAELRPPLRRHPEQHQQALHGEPRLWPALAGARAPPEPAAGERPE